MKKQSGQAIAEYLILTALIAIASIGIIQVLSKNMRGKLDQINAAIIGEKKNSKVHKTLNDKLKCSIWETSQEA